MDGKDKLIKIDIDIKSAIKNIAEYRVELKEVQDAEKDLKKDFDKKKISTQEYNEKLSELKIVEKQYAEQIRVLNKEVNNRIKSEDKEKDSLNALRATLSNVTAEYDNLSRAERQGKKGKELQEEINQLTAEIKGAEYSTQRFYRNVGNYPMQAITAIKETYLATGSLKEASKVAGEQVKIFGKQLLALAKSPIVIIFTGLYTIIKKVADGVKNNEENMDRWNVVMAPLRRTAELLSAGFQTLASHILTLVEYGSKAVKWVMEMAEKLPILGEKIKGYNESLRESIDLEKEQQQLRDANRDFIKKDAKVELEVQRLLTKAYDKANYSAKERLEAIREASSMQQKLAQEEENLALREYDLAYQKSLTSKNDSKTMDELAQKEADLDRARTKREALQTSLKRRESQLLSQIKSEENEAANASKQRAEEAKKASEKANEARSKELQALQEAEDAMLALVKDSFEKQITVTTIQYEREIEALRIKLETEKNLTETAKEAINQTIIAKQEQLNMTLKEMQKQQEYDLEHAGDAEIAAERERLQERIKAEQEYYEQQVAAAEEEAEEEKRIQQSKFDFAASVFGNLSKIAEQFADDNKAMAKLSKVLALGEVAINTGKAIASGVASATSIGFPQNIAAIATTVVTVLSNMATAISTIKGAKFAKGGVVGYSSGGSVVGAGTGTSDSISARLSNGESVQTAMATSMFAPILSAFNQMGGGVPIQTAESNSQTMGEMMLARAVARGVASMPAPVVSVQEVTNVSKRVQAIEQLATV